MQFLKQLEPEVFPGRGLRFQSCSYHPEHIFCVCAPDTAAHVTHCSAQICFTLLNHYLLILLLLLLSFIRRLNRSTFHLLNVMNVVFYETRSSLDAALTDLQSKKETPQFFLPCWAVNLGDDCRTLWPGLRSCMRWNEPSQTSQENN